MIPEEEALFSLCIWREARGEGLAGMTAVAWVIWNRHTKWGRSVHDVIMAPNQFTSMTVEADPPSPATGDAQYAEAYQIVTGIENGTVADPTGGALYYWNPITANSPWFSRAIAGSPQQHPMTAKIFHHEFFA